MRAERPRPTGAQAPRRAALRTRTPPAPHHAPQGARPQRAAARRKGGRAPQRRRGHAGQEVAAALRERERERALARSAPLQRAQQLLQLLRLRGRPARVRRNYVVCMMPAAIGAKPLIQDSSSRSACMRGTSPCASRNSVPVARSPGVLITVSRGHGVRCAARCGPRPLPPRGHAHPAHLHAPAAAHPISNHARPRSAAQRAAPPAPAGRAPCSELANG